MKKIILGTIGAMLSFVIVYIAICFVFRDIIYVHMIVIRIALVVSLIAGIVLPYVEDND